MNKSRATWVLKSTLVQLDVVLATLFLLPLIVLTLFFVAPLVSIAWGLSRFDWSLLLSPFYINLQPMGSPIDTRDVDGRVIVIFKGVDLGVIGNSLFNSILVTFFATLIGTAVAILVGLYDFPGRRVLALLASIPLLVAPFVNAYVVKLLYGVSLQGNTISYVFKLLGLPLEVGFTGLAGITLTQVLAFYPIVYVNVLAVLGAIDATLVEQAINLGSKGFKLIRSIVLPLLAPGILAGATLVYILSLEDVGAPIVFNYRNVMSYQVYLFFKEYTSIGRVGSAAALSLLMLLFALAPLVVVRRYLSLRYYARLTRGAPRPLTRLKLGLVGRLIAYLLVFPIVLASALPQIGVIVLAFSERCVGPLPSGFTLNNYAVLFSKPGVYRGIVNSVTYVLAAIGLIALVGFSAGYSAARLRLPGVGVLDVLSSAPLAVPGLVVAFGYFFFLHLAFKGTILDPLISPGTVLVIAYLVRKMPFTVRSVYAGIIQTPRELEEAASSLGARTRKVLTSILIPLTWRSLVAGLLLSTIYALSEVSVSVTIGALGGDITTPDHSGPITFVILRLIEAPSTIGGAQPQAVAAAMATLLMGIEALVLFIAATRLTRRGQLLISV